jgi:hypothetical protein
LDVAQGPLAHKAWVAATTTTHQRVAFPPERKRERKNYLYISVCPRDSGKDTREREKLHHHKAIVRGWSNTNKIKKWTDLFSFFLYGSRYYFFFLFLFFFVFF